jgi:hypothetical protein
MICYNNIGWGITKFEYKITLYEGEKCIIGVE